MTVTWSWSALTVHRRLRLSCCLVCLSCSDDLAGLIYKRVVQSNGWSICIFCISASSYCGLGFSKSVRSGRSRWLYRHDHFVDPANFAAGCVSTPYRPFQVPYSNLSWQLEYAPNLNRPRQFFYFNRLLSSYMNFCVQDGNGQK